MGKTAFLFPGQGSQRVGMGSELAEARADLFDRYVDLAEEISGLSVRKLCLEGPMEELTRTEVTQPALFAVSLAVADLAREDGLQPDFVAGHSLGEYTAAVASGALDPEPGMRLVCERGRLMAGVQSERPGGMVAVIGLSAERVEGLCQEASADGLLVPANVNAPTQVVCSGEQAAVEKLRELAEQAGADKVVRLPLGAAFHTEMMEPVRRRLGEMMQTVDWSDPETPLVGNASGGIHTSADEVREALLAQITSPVLWTTCVETLLQNGCDTFLELGPGRVLSGLVRRIDSDVETFAADSPSRLSRFVDRNGE